MKFPIKLERFLEYCSTGEQYPIKMQKLELNLESLRVISVRHGDELTFEIHRIAYEQIFQVSLFKPYPSLGMNVAIQQKTDSHFEVYSDGVGDYRSAIDAFFRPWSDWDKLYDPLIHNGNIFISSKNAVIVVKKSVRVSSASLLADFVDIILSRKRRGTQTPSITRKR